MGSDSRRTGLDERLQIDSNSFQGTVHAGSSKTTASGAGSDPADRYLRELIYPKSSRLSIESSVGPVEFLAADA